jgi:hypothetical protein
LTIWNASQSQFRHHHYQTSDNANTEIKLELSIDKKMELKRDAPVFLQSNEVVVHAQRNKHLEHVGVATYNRHEAKHQLTMLGAFLSNNRLDSKPNQNRE